MAEQNTLKLYDFSGGLNTTSNNYFLEDNETPDCLNVTYTQQGAIVKREGYEAILDTELGDQAVNGLYIFHEKDGTRHMLASSGNTLYEINTNNGTSTELKTGITEADTFFTTLDNKVWICNGEDNLLFFDGTNVDTNPNAPVGKYIVANNNHIYIAGNDIHPSRLYYTELDDNGLHEWWPTSDSNGESFTSSYDSWVDLDYSPIQYESEILDTYERGEDYEMDYLNGRIKVLSSGNMSDSTSYDIDYSYKDGEMHYIDVRTNDGDKITGITRQSGNLVIFKTNSIHVLYGTNADRYQLKEVIPNKGAIAPKSVVNINNYIYFLADDGIYTFNGSQVELMSQKINQLINRINNPEDACGSWYKHQYFLTYADQTSNYNNMVLVYNYLYESWTKYDNIHAKMWNNFDGSQDGQVNIGEVYFGDSRKGQIYQFGVGYDDAGDDISLKYATKYYNFDSPEIVKTFREVLVDSISQGEFNLDYDIDRGTSTGTYSIKGYEDKDIYQWGAVTWENLVWHVPKQVVFGTSMDYNAYGRALKVIIREESSKPLNVFGVIFKYRPKRRRY